ncbi:arsenite efflux transporter ArsB-like [Paramyrothecium foliicola]|nr:arsenite efflux transporter ArsB-like [Paramyrothecium foliicola]
MAEDEAPLSIDTNNIKDWRSIVTLIVFVITNLVVLFPFHIPLYIPRSISNGFLDTLSAIRIIPPRQADHGHNHSSATTSSASGGFRPRSVATDKPSRFVRVNFPMNFISAPIIADLFLLAILAIGREEVKGGTVGAQNIAPYDVMVFFVTLAYIAISVDASGLIRYLAFRVLQWGGEAGHRLFFYLYSFFFLVGGFIGNDPIVLSGTPFLAYMTRVSSNIAHPKAWIHTQFAIANIASAILVSSNPTNLVLAGAFRIRFIDYTVNMIVPVAITAILLFPFLLYVVFRNPTLIPKKIEMHQLSEEAKARPPVNPNIPYARGDVAEQEEQAASNTEEGKLLSLEEILNPYLDRPGAIFGGVIMAATLITVLVLNAVRSGEHEQPVFWVTLPASVVMFLWDLGSGWVNRAKTREIARRGRMEAEETRNRRAMLQEEDMRRDQLTQDKAALEDTGHGSDIKLQVLDPMQRDQRTYSHAASVSNDAQTPENLQSERTATNVEQSKGIPADVSTAGPPNKTPEATPSNPVTTQSEPTSGGVLEKRKSSKVQDSSPSRDCERTGSMPAQQHHQHTTLMSLCADAHLWCQETFPTATAVMTHLPFALVPFAFAMFVLVQALVTKGWVPVFAWGWEHWVRKTGVVGAIGGMGFLSVILCNFAGTNIGTTILLSRVIQAWEEIHRQNPDLGAINDRTFWATVYSMAIGVNYGAFSTAFSASLAGMLWRDILGRKHIRVGSLEFARINLPIIAFSMIIGCTILIGQVHASIRPRGSVYAAEARKAFKENLEQPSIENIQTCILIGNSCKGECDSEAESLYFVLANRMAQILRIWVPNEADDGVTRETKIRLWWTCFILDTWASGGSGLSRQTRPAFKKVRVPMDEYVFYNMKSGDADIPDSQWRPGLWGHMVNLVELYVQIQDLHQTLADAVEWDEDFIEDTVRRLDAQLTGFGDNLEAHFHWSLENLKSYVRKGLGSVFVAFHLGYYHYGTLLFYQYLDHRRPATRHGRAYADRCKWNAKMVCDILKASREQEGAEALYNIVGHVTVVSSSVLLHTYLFGEAHELPESRQRLESNLESLAQVRSYWPSVELMINRLVVFQNNCMRTLTKNTYRFDRWMVKFLIQHASALEEKEDDFGVEDMQMATAAEGSQLERSQVTQLMMRDIQSLEFSG